MAVTRNSRLRMRSRFYQSGDDDFHRGPSTHQPAQSLRISFKYRQTDTEPKLFRKVKNVKCKWKFWFWRTFFFILEKWKQSFRYLGRLGSKNNKPSCDLQRFDIFMSLLWHMNWKIVTKTKQILLTRPINKIDSLCCVENNQLFSYFDAWVHELTTLLHYLVV